MRKVLKIELIIVVVVIIIAILHPVVSNNIKYSKAEKLMEKGNYPEANDILFDLELDKFRESEKLREICNAHISYGRGEIDMAEFYMSNVNLDILSKKQRRIEKKFIEQIDSEVDDYIAKKDKEEREYENKVKNGVPFVGMYEKDIDNTKLGTHTSVENQYLNSQNKDDKKIVYAKEYYFKDGDFIIFSAKCVNGRVTWVMDNREKYDEYLKAKKNANKNYHSGSYNPYDSMDDYDDPEDYYYDNMDEYDDYGDAEDDWDDYMDE